MLNARTPRLSRVNLSSRARVTVAALAIAALSAGRALAAGPELPASAIGADTFVVAHVNLAKVDAASVDQTVQAVLGANAAMVAGTPGMQDFKQKLKEITDAGAQTMTIVASGDPNAGENGATGVAYVKLKPGTDHATAEQKLRDEQAKAAAKNPGVKQEETDVSFDGDYMVIRKKGTELPKGGDAARAKMFGGAFSTTDKAIDVVFVPNEKLRAQMKDHMAQDAANQPTWIKAAGPALTEAKSMSLGASLGAAPTLDLAVTAADVDGAKKIADAVTAGKQQLQQQAAAMQQGGPQGAAFAATFTTLANALNPQQSADKVTLSIDVKSVAPAIQSVLPFILMGGGGPRPGGAAPGKPGGL